MEVATALETRPLMQNFGIEVLGLDVTRADPASLEEAVALFHRHGALVVRDQNLSPADQLAFTRLFGEPEKNPRNPEFTCPGYPEIFVISNKIVDGRKIGDHEAGLGWHIDYSYGRNPALCTILHALEVPDEGSDTLLADLCAAWNALPPERQQALQGLRLHFSFARYMEKRGFPLTPEQREELPDVFHPLVRRHPADGRKVLWVSSGPRAVEGMPNPEGAELIQELVRFATQERFVYRHKWRPGDILVWDNRCAMHTGTPFDFEHQIRHIHRSWVKGEVPVA